MLKGQGGDNERMTLAENHDRNIRTEELIIRLNIFRLIKKTYLYCHAFYISFYITFFKLHILNIYLLLK